MNQRNNSSKINVKASQLKIKGDFNMKKQILMSLMVIFTLAFTKANAQRDFQGRGTRGPNPEVVKYMQDNVFPVMKIQHSELEKELTANEKARIVEIRAILKEMHEAKLAKHREMREDFQKPTLEQKKEMREMRNKMSTLMDEVEIMAENHDATITRLFDEISHDIEQWKSDLDEIRDRNFQEGINCPNSRDGKKIQVQGKGICPGASQCPGHGKGEGRGNKPNDDMRPGRGMGPGDERPMHRLFTPEGFLLWNPEKPMPFDGAPENNESSLQLNIFPNPAVNSFQISMMLTTDSQVSINILDKQGNEVQQINSEKASKGLYTKTMDVSKLNDGLYFIKIKAGEESALERLIIKK
jgi:hypothetical protein